MKKLSFILMAVLLAAAQHVHAQYYSVNYDTRTVAAMAAAFGTETVAESYYREQVDDILKHYNAAEVATAGIFASKFLEHKALADLGIWCSSTENYYYRRIYRMVAEKIMPKIWVVAKQMLRSPQTAIYWGSYLMKICDETKSLCMQFESVVTNSTLTFSDVVFLEINRNIAPLLKLSEVGDIDWQRMLDDLASVPGNFTKENLQHDIDNLYDMGVGLATAGIENIGDALLQTSSFHELIGGKVGEIINLYDHYNGLFERVEQDAGHFIIEMVGGEDNVARLFDIGEYDLTGWMTDYLDQTAGNYYTQRWYIARREQGQRFVVRLLPADRRQQHTERRRMGTVRNERSELLPKRFATGTGAFQLGTVCRMVKKPGTATQQPERRLHLYYQLLAERLYHQPGRQADQEGIRLRNTRHKKLEPGNRRLRGRIRFLLDGLEHVQGATQRPPLGVQRQRGGLYLLYNFRCKELLPGNRCRQTTRLRERDHQRNVFGRRHARTGYDAVQVPQVRQLAECPLEGVRHANHRFGQRTGYVRAGRAVAGSRQQGRRPRITNKSLGV